MNIEQKIINGYLKDYFSSKGEETVKKNIEAIGEGYRIGRALSDSEKVRLDIPKRGKGKDELLLNGAEAVALGAIAGGYNFISSYPMSPSTSVLVELAQHSDRFGIVVEQAEDEISAINMAIGAWYGGARGMVTTSGGGFALMQEGVSLAGMIESPLVVHLGQRPGPATGLPTRTEQADLQFVLRAGHGEFPRIIFAPGEIEEAFYLTQRAFNLADKYQIPVFVLTDQYLIDSYYNIPSLKLSKIKVERYIEKTKKDYKRYRLRESGISSRGIPGFGEGVVVVDSDEHDEGGHITEDLILRKRMVEKRLKKSKLLEEEVIPPELFGRENYDILVIGWGSTRNIIKEALEEINRDSIALLHFKQVYPVYQKTADYLKKAKKLVVVENNATSQFSQLIKLSTGIEVDHKVLKYNGLPFSVEEVMENLKEII